MKITISVLGRFHLFNLAKQLQDHNFLARLITSYPKFEVVKYGINPENITSLLSHEIHNRGWRQLSRITESFFNPQYMIFELYDRHASRHLMASSDIFVGLSSGCLYSLRRARRMGAKTVLERGSSHMLYQRKILEEEYRKFGLEKEVVHPKVVERELMEYQEADYISIPSHFVKETFIQQGIPAAKLIQTPYGVDLSNFHPVPKQDKIFRIIHCGGLSIRKGIPYLLQAFSELRLKDAELWLIGSITDEIKPFLRQFSSPAIVHKGPFPEPDLYRYYSQGSVFCLASIEEGFGMVTVQAMACGLPVICTTNAGAADIIREGRDGFILPIRDVDAIKEKILYFYENPEAGRNMGESARLRVQTGFSWSDYGHKMIAAYQNVLSS
ncbi:MAG: glycosyltransferase family 4 protein [Proteobacteria bacterium]|nr:glycosyltransferase family 4 protein [Pseudomonadota bacterium]